MGFFSLFLFILLALFVGRLEKTGWLTKIFKYYFQRGLLLEVFTIADLHTTIRFWACPEPTQLTFTCSKSTIETLEKCEICSKLTIKTPKRRQWHRFGVFIVIFERIFHTFFSVFLLLTLSMYLLPGYTLNVVNAVEAIMITTSP